MTPPVPLTAYSPIVDGDKPLVGERCHARVATEGPNTIYYQCAHRPTTSRPMRSIFHAEPVIKPVCGTHKRVHDDAQEHATRAGVEDMLRNAVASRFRMLVAGTKLDAGVAVLDATDPSAPRVSLPLTLLETILEAGKPVEEYKVNDLVAFIVRDRDRVRYQGVGRIKIIGDGEFTITDTQSGRRYKVKRQDIKRARARATR